MYTNRKTNTYDDVFGIENFTNWDDERSEEFFGLDFGGAVLLGICALVVFCFVVLIKGELTHAKNLKEFYMRNKEAIDGLYLKLKRENLYKQYLLYCIAVRFASRVLRNDKICCLFFFERKGAGNGKTV